MIVQEGFAHFRPSSFCSKLPLSSAHPLINLTMICAKSSGIVWMLGNSLRMVLLELIQIFRLERLRDRKEWVVRREEVFEGRKAGFLETTALSIRLPSEIDILESHMEEREKMRSIKDRRRGGASATCERWQSNEVFLFVLRYQTSFTLVIKGKLRAPMQDLNSDQQRPFWEAVPRQAEKDLTSRSLHPAPLVLVSRCD